MIRVTCAGCEFDEEYPSRRPAEHASELHQQLGKEHVTHLRIPHQVNE